MKNPGRKIILAGLGLGLCLLLGFKAFFQTAPDTPPQPVTGPLTPSPTGPAPPVAGPSTLFAADPANLPPPSPDRPDHSATPAPTEVDLPSLPTGDYEMNLSDEQIDALVETHYGRLFHNLHLSPERQTRLRALLHERQKAAIEAANSAILTGLNPGRDLPTITRAIELAQAEVDEALQTELGEKVLAACQEFERTLPQQNSVYHFGRRLAALREPLLPEQEKQLLRILAEPETETSLDLGRVLFGGVNTQAPIGNKAIAAAAKILSPRQLDLLRDFQAAARPEAMSR